MLGAQPAISQSRAEAEEGQEPSGFPVALLQAVQRQREEVLWKKEKAEWLDWSAATATAQGPSTWQHSPAQLAQLSHGQGHAAELCALVLQRIGLYIEVFDKAKQAYPKRKQHGTGTGRNLGVLPLPLQDSS